MVHAAALSANCLSQFGAVRRAPYVTVLQGAAWPGSRLLAIARPQGTDGIQPTDHHGHLRRSHQRTPGIDRNRFVSRNRHGELRSPGPQDSHPAIRLGCGTAAYAARRSVPHHQREADSAARPGGARHDHARHGYRFRVSFSVPHLQSDFSGAGKRKSPAPLFRGHRACRWGGWIRLALMRSLPWLEPGMAFPPSPHPPSPGVAQKRATPRCRQGRANRASDATQACGRALSGWAWWPVVLQSFES